MDGLDSFLQSVAYKFPKGYPDINNEEDKKRLFEMVSSLTEEESEDKSSTNADEIKSLIDLIKDDKEAEHIWSKMVSLQNDLEELLEDEKIKEEEERLAEKERNIQRVDAQVKGVKW